MHSTTRHFFRHFIPWMIVAIIIAGMEVGVFNLAHWRTRHHDQVTTSQMTVGPGLRDEGNGLYTIVDEENAWIDFPLQSDSDLDPIVESVRVEPAEGNSVRKNTVTFKTRNAEDKWTDARQGIWWDWTRTLTYTHNANTQYFMVGQKDVKVARANLLRLQFQADNNITQADGTVQPTQVSFGGVTVNPTIPRNFSIWRVALMLVIALFTWAFRPSSRLYRTRLDMTQLSQKLALTGFIVVQSAVLIAICGLTSTNNPDAGTTVYSSQFGHWTNPNQYQLLADSLLNGHVNLNVPVDQSLLTMDNPYSFSDRKELADSAPHTFFWDYAYFDGKYYSYFGVVPALLLFVPYQFITGSALPSVMAMRILATVFTIMASLLVTKFISHYFGGKASVGIPALSLFGFILGSGIIYFCYLPNFYAFPISTAMILTVSGLYCWLCSKRPNGTLNAWLIALGSFLIALNLGTRPQFLIVCLLAFPLFWDEITKSRQLFSVKGIPATIAAFAPFVAVLLPFLWYNKIRFGSITDLGSNYNLTGYDMTTQRPSKFLVPASLFIQLFQPVNLTGTFPYINTTTVNLPEPTEPSLGGFFMMIPFALFGLLLCLVKRQLKQRKLWALALTCLGSAFVVIVVDVITCGTNNRYYADSAWLLLLLAIMVIAALASAADEPHAETDLEGNANAVTVAAPLSPVLLRGLLMLSVLFSAFMMYVGLFATGRYEALYYTNPDLFYSAQSWFMGLTA